jgi:ADP-ribosyl-[dinitrogen reductase] hydrolase
LKFRNGGFCCERDLAIDLDAISKWSVGTVQPVIEDHEFDMLNVQHLGKQVDAGGIDWLHLPVGDIASPDRRFEAGWFFNDPRLHALARTVAARLLVECGVLSKIAVERVRRVRPGAIETPKQMQYVLYLPFERELSYGYL